MLSSRLIRKILLTTVSTVLLIGSVNAESIGGVVESTGVGSLERESKQIVEGAVGTKIQLNDTAQTAKGRMLIKFLDDAELSLIEHTKVFIDKIYYDPDPSKSKMVMKMALGTARFASGRLGMVDKSNIDIKTPTATIAVRGTDFTTTIDELGRSLVILLPDEYGAPSGEIVVSNEAGSVTLSQAYAATMVSSISTMPTQTVVIDNITPNVIDNMFIVNPPEEVAQAIEDQRVQEARFDYGQLDADFLAFDELDKDYENYLEEDDFNRLDYDALGGDFLVDLLDIIEELERTMGDLSDQQASTGIGKAVLKGATYGLNNDSQYNIFNEDGGLVFYRDVNGVISLRFLSGGAITVDTEVDGYKGIITADGGGDIVVVIKQSN
ncbi:FecR domain-containing protein [bacterium]|nr:FecR domain-containing protein [bacterium]